MHNAKAMSLKDATRLLHQPSLPALTHERSVPRLAPSKSTPCVGISCTPEPATTRSTPARDEAQLPAQRPPPPVPPSPWAVPLGSRIDGKTLQEQVSSLQKEVDEVEDSLRQISGGRDVSSAGSRPCNTPATLAGQPLLANESRENSTTVHNELLTDSEWILKAGRIRGTAPPSTCVAHSGGRLGSASSWAAFAPEGSKEAACARGPATSREADVHSRSAGTLRIDTCDARGEMPRLRLSSGSGPFPTDASACDTERGSVNNMVDQACAKTNGLLAALRNEAANYVKEIPMEEILCISPVNKKEDTASPASGSSGRRSDGGNTSSASHGNSSCGRFINATNQLAHWIEVMNFRGQETFLVEQFQRQMQSHREALGSMQSKMETIFREHQAAIAREADQRARDTEGRLVARLDAMEKRLDDMATEAAERVIRSSRSSPSLSTRSLGQVSSGASWPSESGSITSKPGGSIRASAGPPAPCKLSPSSGGVNACSRAHSAPSSRRCASPAASSAPTMASTPAKLSTPTASSTACFQAPPPSSAVRRCRTAAPEVSGSRKRVGSPSPDLLVKVQDLPPRWLPNGQTVMRSHWQLVRASVVQ